jgi:hypothetical protein
VKEEEEGKKKEREREERRRVFEAFFQIYKDLSPQPQI